LTHNPAETIDLPRRKPIERVTFTPAELSALLLVAPAEWQTLILLAFYLGGRLRDMVTLSWDGVDLDRGTIFYTQGRLAGASKCRFIQSLSSGSWR
jgi:integrase